MNTRSLADQIRWRSTNDLPDTLKVDFDCYESPQVELLLKNSERYIGYLTENESGTLKKWSVCAPGCVVEVSQELISAWHYLQPLPDGEIK